MGDELPLRRRVAEALGYTVYHYDKGYTPYWMLMDPDFNPVVYAPFREGERASEAEAWNDLPAFDTSLDAAWLAVEAVQARGYQWQIDSSIDYCVVSAWPRKKRRAAGDVSAAAPIPPEAICIAAIEVLRRLKEGTRYVQ